MLPHNYINENYRDMFPPDGNAVLYYPGAYTDDGPLDLFRNNYPGNFTAIYVDYFMNEGDIINFANSLKRKFGYSTMVHISLSDLKLKNTLGLYPAIKKIDVKNKQDFCILEERRENHKQLCPKFAGIRFHFHGNSESPFTLIYLQAEGVQAFKVLNKCGINPGIVVIADHGCGLNWTNFGGDSYFYNQVKKKPQYLYVQGNTKPWPGYSKVSDGFVDIGQQHKHQRSLYKLVMASSQ